MEGGGAISAERDHMGIDASGLLHIHGFALQALRVRELALRCSLGPRVLLLVQASHWRELNGLSVFSVGFSKNV